MRILPSRLQRAMVRRLRRAGRGFLNSFTAIEQGDTRLHHLSQLIHWAGEIGHLEAALGTRFAGAARISGTEATQRIRTLHATDQRVFVERLEKEFVHDLRAFEHTVREDLTPENLTGDEMPFPDRIEFDYFVLYLRDSFEYVASGIADLEGQMGERMRRSVERQDSALRDSLERVLRAYAVNGIRYNDRPEFYPERFWWRGLAWEAYTAVAQTILIPRA